MLAHIDFTVTQRDDGVQRDESVEIYLDPGTEGKYYYQFVLNANNVQGEQANRDRAWFIPWRSATHKSTDHWTAEIALPLSICAGYGDLAKARLNLAYYQIEVGLDQYGAKIGQTRKCYLWSPIEKSVHEPHNFGYLYGLGQAPLESVFLPAVEQIQVNAFHLDNEECYYTISGTMRNYASVPGTVKLVIEDQPIPTGVSYFATTLLTLDSYGTTNFTAKIPVTNFCMRTVKARIYIPESGEIFCNIGDLDVSSLTLMTDVTASRNYYTSEAEAAVRCCLGLPETELKNMRVKVKNLQGTVIAEHSAPTKHQIIPFPIAEVPEGTHQFTLELEDVQGNVLAKENFSFKKLPPHPGHEVKIDKFNLCLLKDDKPVFPRGIYLHGVTHFHEEIFELMAKAGFNLMFRVIRGNTLPESQAAEYMEMAQKYGLMVAEWHGLLPEPAPGKSPQENKQISDTFYKSLLPGLEREIRIMMQYPNFLLHKNVDEPNLYPEIRYLISERFYQTACAIDPYHPVYTLFARSFTDHPLALKVQDIIAFDIYTYPGWGGWEFDPVKQMAKFTADLRKAALAQHKPMFIAPAIQAMEPIRTPVPLSPQEQRAQTYVALLYGAKGLVYFSWGNIYAKEMWDTLTELNQEIATLAPALLMAEPEQNIRYEPGQFDATRLSFPMVHARLFNHPDGGYILLAVNGENAPVKTTFTFSGVPDTTTVQRLFATNQTLPLSGSTFTDELENYGTRAYRVISSKLPEPLLLTLSMQADETRRTPSLNLRQEINKVTQQKNFMPNPVFAKRSKYAQFPDFMRPACPMLPNLGTPDSGWFLDPSHLWNGYPSLCMRWTEPFKKIKYVTTEGNPWTTITKEYGVQNSCSLAFCGVMLTYYPPPSPEPIDMVFSFYAKGARRGDKLDIHWYAANMGKTYELTDDWQRYELTVKCKLIPSWLPGHLLLVRIRPGATVWINGLQMEHGRTPTDFTEN